MDTHGQVILFLGHEASSSSCRAFDRLQAQAASEGDVCWLYDASRGYVPRSVLSRRQHLFSAGQIEALRYSMLQKSLLPGHAHFPLLCFFRDHPGYRNYWLVEYDVRFTGHWGAFFRELAADPAGLVTCHIRRHAEEPGWKWWGLQHPAKVVPIDARLRSFNTIYRLSREALVCLDRELSDGWCGHHEVLIPTLLQHHGFPMSDIGGNGSFTPPGRQGRLYHDARPDANGLMRTGSMRFRPSFWRPGREKGLLYHPIKPLGKVIRDQYKEMRYRVRALRARIRGASPT